MTPHQAQLFAQIAQMGVTCGLEHPYEWLVNYTRHLGMFKPYPEVPQAEKDAIDAYVAFYRDTGPGLEKLTAKQLFKQINRWYETKRSQKK